MVTPPDLSKNLFLLSAVLLPVFEDKKGSFATTASREVQRVDRLLDFFSLSSLATQRRKKSVRIWRKSNLRDRKRMTLT
jgi:hypothetical protein